MYICARVGGSDLGHYIPAQAISSGVVLARGQLLYKRGIFIARGNRVCVCLQEVFLKAWGFSHFCAFAELRVGIMRSIILWNRCGMNNRRRGTFFFSLSR